MRIKFTPQWRTNETLTLEKSNENSLRINGELFNFNSLNPGDIIPEGIIPSELIVGPVEHIDGHVTLTLILPHGFNPKREAAFPEDLIIVDDGKIKLPTDIEEIVNVEA